VTTIAWDGKSLAADRLVSSPGHKYSAKKLRKVELVDGDYLVAGFAGNADACSAMLAWAETGFDEEHKPEVASEDVEGIAAYTTGEVYLIIGTGMLQLTPDEPAAIGSGGSAAMAAMSLGKDALEAVKTARKVDPFTGGRIDCVPVLA
jgi:ATP-dependent protease HslVU (ClpYQ) peptidase subunit